MRVVGSQNRTEIELDPVKAYRRGRAMDVLLLAALPPLPRGVTRGTHEYFNRCDAARQIGDRAPPEWLMTNPDPLLRLLARFREEGVEYVLVGGQAVRLNGYLRATEDIDVLVRATRANGERIIRALSFLPSSTELEPEWFVPDPDGQVENIRVADELLLDLLFAANGQTYESVLEHVRELEVEGVSIRVLNIDGCSTRPIIEDTAGAEPI